MNQAAFFIPNRALFGGYPTYSQVIELKQTGVTCFIDLTHVTETRIVQYTSCVDRRIGYPIQDEGVPRDLKKFLTFLYVIQSVLNNLTSPTEKIYLHCRGGHGRSVLVVACLLALRARSEEPVSNLPLQHFVEEALRYHLARPNLSARWKNGKPVLNDAQMNFVERFFGRLYIYSNLTQVVQLPISQAEWFLINKLLHSGCKTIMGEGPVSCALERFRNNALKCSAEYILRNSPPHFSFSEEHCT